MQLHQLKPKHKNKSRKRVGRGGKKGTYSGKGIKGQKARAGHHFQPIIRELVKKYPKLKGYRFNPRPSEISVVNIGNISKKFEDKDKVNPESLVKKGLIRKIKGKIPSVKILAKGDIDKSLIIEQCKLSEQAIEKIKKAGGEVK